MKEVAIETKGLTKVYRAYDSNREVFRHEVLGINAGREVTAIKDIDLTIYKGDRIALIGGHDSGKNTLIQIMAGIKYPTSGKISVNGTVTEVFDLKAGMVKGLTGRENIRAVGGILGWTKKETEDMEEGIISTAGLADKIDAPLSSYVGSEMAQLGFAIRTAYMGDIVMINSPLMFGGTPYRKRLLSRLEDGIVKEGKTLLLGTFVKTIASKLCNRAVIIDEGSVVFDGDIEEGYKYYKKNMRNVKLEDEASSEKPQEEDQESVNQDEEGFGC